MHKRAIRHTEKNKMVSSSVSLTTLNINKLNSLQKRQWLIGLKKQDPNMCCLQETKFGFKDTHRLKVKGKKEYSMKMVNKRAHLTLLLCGKVDLIKNCQEDKKGFYIQSACQNKKPIIHIIAIYIPNNRISKYIDQRSTELKGGIDSNTIIIGDFNTPFSIMEY